MIRTLAYTLIILIGLVSSQWLIDYKGYLYIAFGDYEVETTLVFAVFSIIIFYSILQFVEWTIIAVLNLLIKQSWIPARWRKNTARTFYTCWCLSFGRRGLARSRKGDA